MDLNPQLGGSTIEEPQKETIQENSSVGFESSPTPGFQSDGPILGLSSEEFNDPNAIAVTIADQKVPIIVLFGPPACGKTMTLVRLTRYLRTKSYKVLPIPSFRPQYDTHYAELCAHFNDVIFSNDAASSTSNISFLLVKVVDKSGNTVCQILEAPGEYYYNPGNDRAFPPYVNNVINSENRKIWCFMVEPDWGEYQYGNGYVEKINNLKSQTKRTDRFIFVYNKVDKSPVVKGLGEINIRQAVKDVSDAYPNIFVSFIKKTLFGNKHNYKFVPFTTGSYSQKNSGGQLYVESPEYYPRKLWDAITNYLKN